MDEPKSDPEQKNPQGNVKQLPSPIEGAHAAVNHSAGCDCRDKKQANWPQHIEALCAVMLVIITGFYTYFAAGQLHKMRRATQAAEGANQIAHDALVLSQRPWIKIKHRIVRPLNFEFGGAAGPAATMTIENTTENVGNSVALDVILWEDVIPLDVDLSTTSARKRRRDWCDANKLFDTKSRTQLEGYSLFPRDQPWIQEYDVGPLISDITKAVEANAHGIAGHFKGTGPLVGKVGFVMIGCVLYRSSFEQDGTRPHETDFLYRLGELKAGGMMPFVNPHGVANKLRLFMAPDGFSAN